MLIPLMRYPRRRVLPVLAVTVLACGSGWAFAQQAAPLPVVPGAPQPSNPAEQESPQGRMIKAVTIEGLKMVPEAFVRARLRTRAGNTYDEAEVRSDLRRLIEANRFNAADATYRIDPDGQAIVVFRVQEKAVLSQIQFEGNSRVSTKDLLGATGLTAGQPADIFALRQAMDKVQQKYREEGYYYIQVNLDEEKLQTQGIALFRIVEGPRVKTRKIEFEGNKSFPASRLVGTLETKTYIWIFRKGTYDPEVVGRDENNIANFYRDQGYLDVRVSHRLEFAPNREDLTLVFLIDEGQQYSIKEIAFEGNTVLRDVELLGMMRLQLGSPLLQDYVKADIKAIREAYGSRGYIYAEINAVPSFLPEPALVRLTIHIKEGPMIHVADVVIRGNEQTQDRVVRRQVTLFPGDIYDSTKQEPMKNRLFETQLFEDVEVRDAGGEGDTRNLLVRVSEANTVQFIVGAGITSNNGLLGNITLENRNFDIGKPPKTAGEFFRGRAYKGAGQIFRIQLEPGTEMMRFRVSFREPYLLEKPISLGMSAYIFERYRDDYDEGRTGGTMSLGKRLQKGFLKDWYVEGAGRWENVDISGVDWDAAKDIREAKGSHYLSTFKFSLMRDRTDSAWFPSTGDRLMLSTEQAGVFGGEYTFNKVEAGYNWYRTLRTDIFDRKTVWANRVNSGYIFGDVPVFERFYGGGIGSLRGFAYRGVSPRQGFNEGQAVGGSFLLLGGSEVSYPLFGKELRGVFFSDMGTVEEDFEITSWRVSVGFGMRFILRLFGPVPMSFDFGFPIAKDGNDDTQVFSFSLGTTL
jgi:outer membrane protein insertion porin family